MINNLAAVLTHTEDVAMLHRRSLCIISSRHSCHAAELCTVYLVHHGSSPHVHGPRYFELCQVHNPSIVRGYADRNWEGSVPLILYAVVI